MFSSQIGVTRLRGFERVSSGMFGEYRDAMVSQVLLFSLSVQVVPDFMAGRRSRLWESVGHLAGGATWFSGS